MVRSWAHDDDDDDDDDHGDEAGRVQRRRCPLPTQGRLSTRR